MKITIHFPPLMNMYHREVIEITDPLTLEKTKNFVFKKFQQDMINLFHFSHPINGSGRDVILKERGVVIYSENQWNSLPLQMATIEASFEDNPLTRVSDSYSLIE